LVSATSIVKWEADFSAWSKQVEGAEGQKQNVMGRVLQVYYVAPSGNDGNPGTEAQPFRTIGQGVGVARAGDTVYVREGTYYERVIVRSSGTADDPIVISAYPGERPVIDGECEDCPFDWNSLVLIRGNYIVFDGFEVKRSSCFGVRMKGEHVIVRNLDVHHNMGNGIHVSGDYGLVENCEVWWNSRQNEYGEASNWGAGLVAGRYPSHVTLRNNIVYNNWGEGLSTWEAAYTVIEDNIVYDNWNVQLYIDNTPYAVIRRNLVYDTGDSYFGVRKSSAISVMDEDYGKPARSHHLTIVNNLAMGGSHAFRFGRELPDGGLKDSLIAYNTFVNSHAGATFQIGSGNHRNTRIESNLILEEGTVAIASVVDDSELQFSNNLWSKAPPASASGPGDVVGDPQLAKSGAIGPDLLTPDWFKLLASSPAQDRAGVVAEVTEDFFGNTRQSKPDIGAIERHSSVIHLPMIWKN